MYSRNLHALFSVAALVFIDYGTMAAEPRVVNDQYKLELVAKEPEIVTPIGLAFDHQGRLLVVESHTHQRPKDYKGPAGDRIRMLADSDGDGKLDHWSTFAEGFHQAMNLLVRKDGGVYVVTRRSVLLLQDTNNDGVADREEEILRLESKDDYPHNGLSGICLSADGNSLLVSMGENHGIPYRLIGSDGLVLTGKDGAGSVFQCSLNGSDLKRVAVGFWNPFSVQQLKDGRIFAIDNDPDASPPCRLVHVVWGGDYGFRLQYGRTGTHPLQAWNGELPGTLPFVCGVGEAPTALVVHAGGLWVTSWGDHQIERYDLMPRGASYGAKQTIVVQGEADFRPTGMAAAPDGSLYFGDWVLKDYAVHGHGRIWRLTLPAGELKKQFPGRSSEDLFSDASHNDEGPKLESADPFFHAHGVWQLVQAKDWKAIPAANGSGVSLERLSVNRSRVRLGLLEVARLRDASDAEKQLREALKDSSPDVRLMAVRWIADERITALRDEVTKLLDGPQPTPRYYLAVLAAIDWLDHKPSLHKSGFNDALLVRELQNDKRSPAAHALALKLISPDNKFLTLDRLREYLKSGDQTLRLEAVRTLAEQENPERGNLLAEVAADESQSEEIRAEAIAGLAAWSDHCPPAQALRGFTEDKNQVLRREANRAVRLSTNQLPHETKPVATDIDAWIRQLAGQGDAASGRRLFFSPAGPRCSVCHKYDGRGGVIGPDLTDIGRSTPRERIITSILQPSAEIAPDYQAWILQTDDGKTYTGLRAEAGRQWDGRLHRCDRQDVHAPQRVDRRAPRSGELDHAGQPASHAHDRRPPRHRHVSKPRRPMTKTFRSVTRGELCVH